MEYNMRNRETSPIVIREAHRLVSNMFVKHMKIESYRCNKVTLTNWGGIVVNRYLFIERIYLLKIFTLQTFVLNQF